MTQPNDPIPAAPPERCPNCGSVTHLHCTREQDMPLAKAIAETMERVLREQRELPRRTDPTPAAPKCGYCDQPATTSNGNCTEHYGRPPAGEWAEPNARMPCKHERVTMRRISRAMNISGPYCADCNTFLPVDTKAAGAESLLGDPIRVADPTPDARKRAEAWRVGSKVPLNVYEGDRPVCQCHTAIDAKRIVAAINSCIEVERNDATPDAQKRAEVEAREWLIAYINSQRVEGDRNLRWEDIDEDALLYGIPTSELLAAYASKITAEQDAHWQHLMHNVYSLLTDKACDELVALGMATSAAVTMRAEADALRQQLDEIRRERDFQWKERKEHRDARQAAESQLAALRQQVEKLKPQAMELQETLGRMWASKSLDAEDSSILHHLWGIAQRLAVALKEPPVTAPAK